MSIKPKVGMGVTETLYTDTNVYTISRVSDTGKIFWAKLDKTTLDPNFKPEFHPGGFSGHVSNNYEQKWVCEENPEAKEVMFKLTKSGKWSVRGNRKVRLGVKHKFYDYNF